MLSSSFLPLPWVPEVCLARFPVSVNVSIVGRHRLAFCRQVTKRAARNLWHPGYFSPFRRRNSRWVPCLNFRHQISPQMFYSPRGRMPNARKGLGAFWASTPENVGSLDTRFRSSLSIPRKALNILKKPNKTKRFPVKNIYKESLGVMLEF